MARTGFLCACDGSCVMPPEEQGVLLFGVALAMEPVVAGSVGGVVASRSRATVAGRVGVGPLHLEAGAWRDLGDRRTSFVAAFGPRFRHQRLRVEPWIAGWVGLPDPACRGRCGSWESIDPTPMEARWSVGADVTVRSAPWTYALSGGVARFEEDATGVVGQLTFGLLVSPLVADSVLTLDVTKALGVRAVAVAPGVMWLEATRQSGVDRLPRPVPPGLGVGLRAKAGAFEGRIDALRTATGFAGVASIGLATSLRRAGER